MRREATFHDLEGQSVFTIGGGVGPGHALTGERFPDDRAEAVVIRA